jgi:hypothetical protein
MNESEGGEKIRKFIIERVEDFFLVFKGQNKTTHNKVL